MTISPSIEGTDSGDDAVAVTLSSKSLHYLYLNTDIRYKGVP